MKNIKTKTWLKTGSMSWIVTQFSDQLQVIGHKLVEEFAVSWNPFVIVINIGTKSGLRTGSISSIVIQFSDLLQVIGYELVGELAVS